MKMTREEMLSLLGKRDASYNGKYIIGVLSTGIYCLPSCSARTPKPENVQFFASGAEAEAAGLRPCKRCRPDEWERGEDRELEHLEAVVAAVRRIPPRYSCVPEIGEALAVGTTKLHELFRTHYQATPGEILLQAKLECAKSKLTQTTDGIAEIAYESGFESLSVFNENFRRRQCLTPSEFRRLSEAESFAIQLPGGFDLESFRSAFSRDPMSPTERMDGDDCLLATPMGNLVRFRLGSTVAAHARPGTARDAYKTLHRVLGLGQDPAAFEQVALQRGHVALYRDRVGARIPQTLSLFDGIIWAIVGQQVNLGFAYKLRQRLFELYGQPVGAGLFAVPKPERLAQLEPDELLPLQFSRRKAEYLIGVAKLGEAWLGDLEAMSVTRATQTLMNTRGFGIWSTQYLLMRSLAYPDCVPLGDTGLSAGLRRFFALDEKPDTQKIEALMAAFSPHRSLATYHLWKSFA